VAGQYSFRGWSGTSHASTFQSLTLRGTFNPLAEQYKIKYHLTLTDHRPKVVILVSGYDLCLADLLYRHGTGELGCDIVIMISNHDKAKPLADFYGIPFHLLSSPQDNVSRR
jgi:formyltetrahydrofolate deformylase